MKTKSIDKKNKNQALNNRLFSSQVQFPTLSQKSLIAQVFFWRWRKRKVFNVLCEFQNACRTVWPSVATIAKRARVSERLVHYCLVEFEREHLLKREMRIYNTNIYHLNPSLLSYWLRRALKEWLPALAFVPFMILATAQAKYTHKKHQRMSAQVNRTIREYDTFCTLLKKNTSYFKKHNESNSHLEKGGRDMASIFTQKEKDLIQEKYKRPKTGSYAIYRGKYVPRSSPPAVELSLEQNAQFRENLQRLGINPDGFLVDKKKALAPNDDEIASILNEEEECNETTFDWL